MPLVDVQQMQGTDDPKCQRKFEIVEVLNRERRNGWDAPRLFWASPSVIPIYRRRKRAEDRDKANRNKTGPKSEAGIKDVW